MADARRLRSSPGLCSDASGAPAQTRRAFVLGVKNYADRDIQTLVLSDADAKDVASDLEQVGFDKKNITTALNLRAKADFDRQFTLSCDDKGR